jgi:hypothetical protein
MRQLHSTTSWLVINLENTLTGNSGSFLGVNSVLSACIRFSEILQIAKLSRAASWGTFRAAVHSSGNP